MKNKLAATLVALGCCIGAAQAQVSGASMPVPQPGSSQDNPIRPYYSWDYDGGKGVLYYGSFFHSGGQQWYSAPIRDSYLVECFVACDDFSFVSIAAPLGFENLTVKVAGLILTNDFDGGASLQFGAGVRAFEISGVPKGVAAGAAMPSSFPLFISRLGSASTMYWSGRSDVSPVPETDTLVMMLLGFAMVGGVLRRRSA